MSMSVRGRGTCWYHTIPRREGEEWPMTMVEGDIESIDAFEGVRFTEQLEIDFFFP